MASKATVHKTAAANQSERPRTLASELSVLGSSGYLTVRTEKAAPASAKVEKQRSKKN